MDKPVRLQEEESDDDEVEVEICSPTLPSGHHEIRDIPEDEPLLSASPQHASPPPTTTSLASSAVVAPLSTPMPVPMPVPVLKAGHDNPLAPRVQRAPQGSLASIAPVPHEMLGPAVDFVDVGDQPTIPPPYPLLFGDASAGVGGPERRVRYLHGLNYVMPERAVLSMDNEIGEADQMLRGAVKNLLRLPNEAIQQTLNVIDISEMSEVNEYGDVRPGWFWKLVHDVLFGSNTIHGQITGIVLLILISASVIMATLDSVSWIRNEYGDTIYLLELFFTIVFSIEYVFRVACLRKPSEYMCSAMGVVDICSITPTLLTLILPLSRDLADLATLRIFRVIRVFRILRLVRFVDAAKALNENMDANKLRIAVFMFTVFSLIIVIGCTMYLIEGEENGFSNIPVSLYWAVVTLTTVGYGDIAPRTVPGRLLSCLVMFSGYGVIACPLVLTAQTEEESLKNNCECVRCFRRLHQMDANFCRHCGTALRLPKSRLRRRKLLTDASGSNLDPLEEQDQSYGSGGSSGDNSADVSRTNSISANVVVDTFGDPDRPRMVLAPCQQPRKCSN